MGFIKKDHYVFGMLIGLLMPVFLYLLFFLINHILLLAGIARVYLDNETHILISLFGNLLPIRYYFVMLKFDKTGRGVLLFTFVSILLFFVFKEHIGISI